MDSFQNLQPKTPPAERRPVQSSHVSFVDTTDSSRSNLPPIFNIQALSLYYSARRVLENVSLNIPRQSVTALIGPSGCGKSSLLRCLNRMNDFIPQTRVTGRILFQNQDIYAQEINTVQLRRYIGMVFQKSNPFPRSIFENIAFGLRLHDLAKGNALKDEVEACLTRVGLWTEVKDRLNQNALTLSGGQQQRLCIARAISVRPQVLMMDEPASALDPVATATIEELILALKAEFSVIIVTHNLQQAGRVAEQTAFFYNGQLVEYDLTENMFSNPKNPSTEAFLNGRFG